MKLLLVSIFTSFSITPSLWAFDQKHDQWSIVLKNYQNAQGMMNYKKLKFDSEQDKAHLFNQYLVNIQNVPMNDFDSWNKNDKMAFLINAYNALTVKLIIKNYPVASIKKIGGLFKKPWGIEFFSLLEGKFKSLDPIEHEWLRPIGKDYRIHAAVNCASISCPPLRHEAFIGSKIDAQLNDQMAAWLKDKTRNDLSSNPKVFKVSKIFAWYKKDFVTWGGGVKAVLNKHMTSPLASESIKQIKIEYLDYNWNLNEGQ